jgi:hypothetical protein
MCVQHLTHALDPPSRMVGLLSVPRAPSMQGEGCLRLFHAEGWLGRSGGSGGAITSGPNHPASAPRPRMGCCAVCCCAAPPRRYSSISRGEAKLAYAHNSRR